MNSIESKKILVLLSGPIAVGKTTIANAIAGRLCAKFISSSKYLKEQALKAGVAKPTRADLQNFGDSLDVATDYRWLVDDVAVPTMRADPEQKWWLLDSVRKRRQVHHFHDLTGVCVMHIHISAPEALIRQRYEERAMGPACPDLTITYEAAVSHPNELAARSLGDVANKEFNLSSTNIEDILTYLEKGAGE